MRGERSPSGTTSDLDGLRTATGRVASIRLRWWNRRRVGLLLAGAILLPWLPIPRPWPETRTARRSFGTSGTVIKRLAFGLDAQVVATVDERGSVRLRRVIAGPCAERVVDVPGFAQAIAFSPDGRRLATASGDGSAGLWDVDTGRQLLRLETGAATLGCIAFSPDGTTLVAAGNDNDLRIWDLTLPIERPAGRD